MNPEIENETTQRVSERLFWPRTSEAITELAEALSREPERPLSDGDKQAVLSFEEQLFRGNYSPDLSAEISLEEVVTTEDNSVQFVPEYFLTKEGRNQFYETLGIPLPDTDDIDLISDQLHALPTELLNNPDNQKKLQDLQGSSLGYLKARYVDMALGQVDARDIDTVTLIKDPNKLLNRAKGLRQNKSFIREVRKSLRELGDGDVEAAKLMVTDIYRDIINNQLAGLFPSLSHLLRQYEARGEEIDEQAHGEIMSMVKTVQVAERSTDLHDQFLRLLDYVRNGAALDVDGNLTPIDEQIFDDSQKLNALPAENDSEFFTREQLDEFEDYVFDSAKMEAFICAYLQETGLAKEGWQVNVRTDTNTFAVNSIQKLIKLPMSYNSTVNRQFPATGVVGIIEHEIGGENPGHVMQSVNAERNPLLLQIAKSPKYRGKRYISMREAGGTYAEADAMRRYFGQVRRATSSYASAMKTLLEGGTHADATRSFAEAQLAGRESSEEDIIKAYKIGADRVMRLLRYGGRNSQPLQYVEAATVRRVAEGLSQDMVDTMFAEAVFDPVDMIRLHKFGLLSTGGEHRFTPDRPPAVILADLLNKEFDKED